MRDSVGKQILLKNGSWNGLVADVASGKADIAIADLTINSQRMRVVNFSYPFFRSGFGIMMRKNSQIIYEFGGVSFYGIIGLLVMVIMIIIVVI